MQTLLVIEEKDAVVSEIESFAKSSFLQIENVISAKDSAQAIKYLTSQKIDFIIADINIKKFDGIAFTKRAKQLCPDVKIILVAGFEYIDYAASALKVGADEYVLKPLSRTDIIDVLQKVKDLQKGEQSNIQLSSYSAQPQKDKKETLDANKASIANYLHDHIADPNISLATLAKLFGFSDGYFGQLFKKLFRTTFRTYILNLRLERSKMLLLSTRWKNYEIAAAIGIQDPNYFSTCFKRKYGMTTTEFRETQSENTVQSNVVG